MLSPHVIFVKPIGMAASYTGYLCWEVQAGQLESETCCCCTYNIATSPPLGPPWGHWWDLALASLSMRLRRTYALAAAAPARNLLLHPRAALLPAFPRFPPNRGRSVLSTFLWPGIELNHWKKKVLHTHRHTDTHSLGDEKLKLETNWVLRKGLLKS